MVERRTASLKQQRSVETRDALLVSAAKAFAEHSYSGARLRSIATDSGISEGAMYFHFGTKAELATAVLNEQQRRMTGVLESIDSESGTGLDKLVLVITRLAELIAEDSVVQGGIQLASDPKIEIADAVRDPYFQWIGIGRSLVERGIEDGSIDSKADAEAAAEYANALFVGAQVLSGLEDNWASFPARMGRLIPFLRAELGA